MQRPASVELLGAAHQDMESSGDAAPPGGAPNPTGPTVDLPAQPPVTADPVSPSHTRSRSAVQGSRSIAGHLSNPQSRCASRSRGSSRERGTSRRTNPAPTLAGPLHSATPSSSDIEGVKVINNRPLSRPSRSLEGTVVGNVAASAIIGGLDTIMGEALPPITPELEIALARGTNHVHDARTVGEVHDEDTGSIRGRGLAIGDTIPYGSTPHSAHALPPDHGTLHTDTGGDTDPEAHPVEGDSPSRRRKRRCQRIADVEASVQVDDAQRQMAAAMAQLQHQQQLVQQAPQPPPLVPPAGGPGDDPPPPPQAPPPLGGAPDVAATLNAAVAAPTWVEPEGMPRSSLVAQSHLGDHSITTSDVAATPLAHLPATSASPNYLLSALRLVEANPGNFSVNANNELQIRSFVIPRSRRLENAASHEMITDAFETNADPLLDSNADILYQTWCLPRIVSAVSRTLIDPFLTGGMPNMETFAAVWQPFFASANANFLGALVNSVDSHMFYYDVSAVYLKLAYWAMVLDNIQFMGLNPAFDSYPVGNPITWTDLTDTHTNSSALANAFAAGDLIFFEDVDYSRDELYLLVWLAHAGARVSVIAGQRSPDFIYVKFQEIKIHVVARRAQPAPLPGPGNPTSAAIYGFLYRLATKRSEFIDYRKGLYLALNLLPIRFRVHGGRHYRLSGTFSNFVPPVPKPVQRNIFVVWMRSVQPVEQDLRNEINNWSAARPFDRACVTALYAQLQRVFSTTIIGSYSLCVTNLIDYMIGASEQAFANSVLGQLDTPPVGQLASCMFWDWQARCFEAYTGMSIEPNPYPGQPWLGGLGRFPNIRATVDAFNWTNDVAPREGSMLVVDDFLLVRPVEWGVVGPTTKVDFTSDLKISGVAANMGLYSFRGDRSYIKATGTNTPFLIIPYGIQMVNIFTQFYALNDHCPWYHSAPFIGGMQTEFQCQAQHYGSHSFNNKLHIFEPMTIWTYDYGANEVRAPAVMSDEMTNDRADDVEIWTGQYMVRVGFGLKRAFKVRQTWLNQAGPF
ncbi:unnamed protein product [Bemisia tabaci]|uniref:Uncharacterized protein n=1 Tax=Bemisia tabaci TaxID=7038 RepID=A0A9P0AKE1_BEMTA|nr:unnamed protein product [Bemisia tabaci]